MAGGVEKVLPSSQLTSVVVTVTSVLYFKDGRSPVWKRPS